MSGPPPVFRAIYSNTEVYECDMNESPIMRRCKDDWVNATQILKCCNFPKAKRTKILEKGVQQGLHEKVQGGFGRFQGTWIPLEDARRLASTYGVTKELAPVLFLDFNDPNLVIPVKAKPPPKENTNLVKRKYVKKPKEPGDTPKKYKTGKKAALQQAAEMAAAEAAAAAADTSMGGITASGHSSFVSQDTSGVLSRQNSYVVPPNSYPQVFNNGQQGVAKPLPQSASHSYDHIALTPHSAGASFSQPDYQAINGSGSLSNSQNGYPNQQMLSRFQQLQPQQFPQVYPQQNSNVRQFPVPIPNPIPPQVYAEGKVLSSQSSNESNWSVHHDPKESDTSMNSSVDERKAYNDGNQFPQEEPSPGDDNTYAAQLLKFFSEDSADIPYFIHSPPSDFNINEPIDDEGHTPLHWAASIGNFEMIHILMSKGANPLIVNNFGLNPLSKLISFNNCYEMRNFDNVLNDLELCLINTDINGRTPLHYLCQYAKVKSKFESLQSYLNSILTKLQILTEQSQARSVNLMKNVLNHQDVRGDTCLHIAIKSGCISFIQTLLKCGARDDIENINRETAGGLIMQYNLIPNYAQVGAAQEAYQAQLSMGFFEPKGTLRTLQEPQVPIQGLATPIQPSFNRVETPDTQKTTVQDDEAEEEDEEMARVDDRHLDALNDDKENIFIEKHGENVSSPGQRNNFTSAHQPLAVISEIDTAGSPASVTSSQHPVIGQQSPQSHYTKIPHQSLNEKSHHSSRQLFKRPNPPKLDEEGRIIKDEDSKPHLPFEDLSTMVSGMISSLSDSYEDESQKLDKELDLLKSTIAGKQSETKKSMKHIRKLFLSSGIDEENEDITNLEEAQSIVNKHIEFCQQSITENEFRTTNIMQRNQAYELASLVQREEQAIMEAKQNDQDEDDNETLANEEKFDLAIELTQYQLQRNKLVGEIAKRTKMFGIDDTMYKYRKLLSLSCGVRVEDIDSLIDGIAESLTEGR
ncbi:SWI4 [Candida margitis]|uniref:SWI4 n=1 Tax=Candida margitis TaxID=1775924 RepID=UPI0022277314|nr:SWI4 [Candida margitis]KAI5961775.1 SWI4 [Candida margitis]